MKYALVLGVVVCLALAPSALAHDTYVDQGTGHDASNDCAAKATPCKTMQRGLGQAGTGETVFVQGGHTYTASLVLNDRKSLVAKDFVGTGGFAVLDNGSAGVPDVLNPSVAPSGHVAAAGKVKGFVIRSATLPVEIDAKMTLKGNQITEARAIPADVKVGAAADATISHNLLNDPTKASSVPADQQTAIAVPSTGRVKIVGNAITGFWESIDVSGAGAHATIERNTISGTHEVSSYAGSAIVVLAGVARADIADNRVVAPDLTLSNGVVEGIVLLANGAITGNLVRAGFAQGIAINNTSKPVRIESDLVLTKADEIGLDVADDHPDAAPDAKIVNFTAWGDGVPFQMAKAQVTIDSSIIGAGGIKLFYGSNKCSISHSRGPTKSSGDHGCKDFSTTANPKFRSDDYHLKSSSPMIDKGNPQKPPKHTKDIDGDKRALPGDCGAKHPKARRDIGAYEFKCKKGHH